MRFRWAHVYAGAVVVLIGLVTVVPRASALKAAGAHVTGVTINGARVGAAFQGVGAISGGGGNSRLLIDYPNPQRSRSWTTCSSPATGPTCRSSSWRSAATPTRPTAPSPPSSRPRATSTATPGTSSGWPSRPGRSTPTSSCTACSGTRPTGSAARSGWTQADIGYIIDWLNCAAKDGLKVNYIGGWNEHSARHHPGDHATGSSTCGPRSTTPATEHADRRRGLVRQGQQARRRRQLLARHPAFRKAVSVLGLPQPVPLSRHRQQLHGAGGRPQVGQADLGVRIGALRETTGIPAMARSLVNAFIQVNATGLIEWPLVSSMPAYLPEEDRGLMLRPAALERALQRQPDGLGARPDQPVHRARLAAHQRRPAASWAARSGPTPPTSRPATTPGAWWPRPPRPRGTRPSPCTSTPACPIAAVHVWSTNLNHQALRSLDVQPGHRASLAQQLQLHASGPTSSTPSPPPPARAREARTSPPPRPCRCPTPRRLTPRTSPRTSVLRTAHSSTSGAARPRSSRPP